MKAYKAAHAAITLVLLFLSAESAAQSRSVPLDSERVIGDVDRRYLTQIVRRTLVAGTDPDQEYKATYVPPTLADLRCLTVVTVRRDGVALGIGISNELPILEACGEGAELAGQSLEAGGVYDTESLKGMRIEIEVLGRPVAFEGPGKWTDPGNLERFIDAGREGVNLELDGCQKWFTPSQMISKGLSLREATRELGKELTPNPDALPEATLSKISTQHWWEVDGKGSVVSLRRGLVLLQLNEMTPAAVDYAIGRLGDYLVYRQRPDGTFAEEYDPADDMWSDGVDYSVQAGAVWGAAVGNDVLRQENTSRMAEKSVSRMLKQVVTLPGVSEAAFVATPDNRNTLGTTAFFCLALTEKGLASRHAATRRKLARGLLWLQSESGRFATAFPPTEVLPTQEVEPGLALFALARCYELEPSAEILTCFDRALAFYRAYFRESRPAGMVPWQGQAFSLMAGLTKKRAYADFVFEMNDQLCLWQKTKENCESAELWGGVSLRPGMVPGASTAAYTQGFVAASLLAKKLGDKERARGYREAARLGTRYVMQLQFRPEECYYVRTPKDTLNGIRTSPVDCTIHIDGCRDGLMALVEARQLLFASEK